MAPVIEMSTYKTRPGKRAAFMRAFPDLASREPMKSRFYDGALWKGELEQLLLPMLEKYDVVLVEDTEGISYPDPRGQPMSASYVHGYQPRENERLQDQAGTLVGLLHADTAYPAGSLVLEAGCGVGAQTITLARQSPAARFTSIDVSADSIADARRRIESAGLTNVQFRQADIFALPFDPESFDHVFVCFVLEHLSRPVEALTLLASVLRPGGTITVIEGDHGSTYFHPESAAALEAIQCLVTLQREGGGNSLIGRELYPRMVEAGFDAVHVSPRMVYVDASRPSLVDGFTRKTFTAMIEGIREPAIARGLIAASRFDEGIRDLYRTADTDGVFCYTFFKGVGTKKSSV